jgi:hypothetical protein
MAGRSEEAAGPRDEKTNLFFVFFVFFLIFVSSWFRLSVSS